MTRDGLALPSLPTSLDGFPDFALDDDASIYRATAKERSPWWFEYRPDYISGRFNLHGPRGTMYAADNDLTGVLERLSISLFHGISHDELDQIDVHTLSLATPARLADMASVDATQFGVTREISTAHYALTQQWADALNEVGFDGVRYGPRFDPRGESHAYAIFGDAGPAELGTSLNRTTASYLAVNVRQIAPIDPSTLDIEE